QLPHCDTNLIDIYESEEALNNQALISEGSQSATISDNSSEMLESEFYSDIEQIQENYSDINMGKFQNIDDLYDYYIDEPQNIDEPYDQDMKVLQNNNDLYDQDIDNDSAQKIYDDLLSLYYSETRESSKNTFFRTY
ncbi:19785_t:CDS:1, partial [Dentiscutata erythropus]